MSLPTFPSFDPPISREDAINYILTSIAMEEVGLSHIINAEGEKIQYVLGTLSGMTGSDATIDDVLATNESVKSVLATSVQNQMLLNSKMQSALNSSVLVGPTGPAGPTGPSGGPIGPTETFIIGNCKKPLFHADKEYKIKYELSHYTGYRLLDKQGGFSVF